MDELALLGHTIHLGCGVKAVAWRQREEVSANGEEVILFTDRGVVPVTGLGCSNPVDNIVVGAALDIRMGSPNALQPDETPPWQQATCAASDGSGDIFFSTQKGIWKLEASNAVHFVTGRRSLDGQGGPGEGAFDGITKIVHGTDGVLYVLDGPAVRMVQRRAFPAQQAVSVSTLQLSINVKSMSCDPKTHTLYLATSSVVYKVPEPVGGSVAMQPVFLAGQQHVVRDSDPYTPTPDTTSGPAHFASINDLSVASNGQLLVLDIMPYYHAAYNFLSTLLPSGCKLGRRHNISHRLDSLQLLPQGGMIFYSSRCSFIAFLELDVRPHGMSGKPIPRTLFDMEGLTADLGSLLGSSPPFPPDVTVVVGGRAFPAHRLVLASRCEYFARRFAGGFRDSDDSMIALEGADPEAFELLLRYMYTGELRPTGALLRPLLELADRLLLLRASQHLLGQLREGSSPATVVADMMWAAEWGLEGALEGLKAYYLEVAAEVAEQAPDSLMRLMTQQPKIYMELSIEVAKCARKLRV